MLLTLHIVDVIKTNPHTLTLHTQNIFSSLYHNIIIPIMDFYCICKKATM